MVLVGTEVFDLMEIIVQLPKERLLENELFLRFCDYTSDGETFMMKSEDIIPFIHADWLNLSTGDTDHFKIDHMNNVVIFYNMDCLMTGLDEIYKYISQAYYIDCIVVKRVLISRCLEKIDLCLNMNDLFDQIGLMNLQ